MKTDIKKVKYNEASASADWWTWNETCDGCKKSIYVSGELLQLDKPKLDTKDFCVNCLREMLKETIRHDN